MSNYSLVYLLDSNVCIIYLKGKAEGIKIKLDSLRKEQIAVCAEVYGRIRRDLANQGKPIGANYLLIASIAMANNLVLVTHNVREFSRVKDLQIEDWETLS